MSLGLFDTHTHLDAEQFDDDRTEVIERARAAGVSRFLTVGAGKGFQSAQNAIRLAEKYDFIWASAGVHPHDAGLEFDIDKLRQFAAHERVVAIGETGLDFYRDWSPVDLQERWFRAQIELALELRKPLIIHSRDAGEKCFAILKEMDAQKVGGVFHCYSEDAGFAARLRDINFLVSIPGSITFKKAESFRDTVKEIPVTQLMIETDAPYISPEPYRGKRCESSFMVETAKVVARVKEMSLDELTAATNTNAENLFKLTA